MYYDYFGLKQPPFRITPDTSLFYPGGERGAVLEALVYAVLNGEGIVKVVGEVGSGKTMLCRMLEKELPEKVEIVYLANPSLSPENILHAIAFELKLELPSAASRFEVMNRLQKYLLQRHSEGRQVVVFVEEAQGMPLETLEEIRLLSNLETQQHKLLQIVLFGQPELDDMIATPEIRQLKERITYSFRLNPFAPDDIRDYLNSRIRACGYRSGTLFDHTAIRAIDRFSRGLLRRVNILADKALLAAYAENTHRVTARHIRQAARDSEFVTNTRGRRRGRFWIMAAVAAVILLVVLLPQVPWPGLPGGVTRAPAAAPAAATATAPAPTQSAPPAQAQAAEQAAAVTPAAKTSGAAQTDAVSPQAEATGSGAAAPPAPTPAVSPLTVEDVESLSGPPLSADEIEGLRRQLRKLPPESALVSGFSPSGDSCEHCSALVYRPVATGENL